MAHCDLVQEQECLGSEGRSNECLEMEHKWGVHNSGVVWDTPMAKSAGEVKDRKVCREDLEDYGMRYL